MVSRRTTVLAAVSGGVALLFYSFLLVEAWREYGFNRILGWDSLFYAFSTQEVFRQGIPWFMAFWNHPNVYALLLAGVSAFIGDIGLATNLLPVAMVGLLALVSAILGTKLGGNWGVGILAALLTILSLSTFRMFVDLHRGLFAFLGITALLALDAPKAFTRANLGFRGLLSLGILFVVTFSEFEMYLVFALAGLLTLVLRREGLIKSLFSVGWIALPGTFMLLFPHPWQTLDAVLLVGGSGVAQQLTADAVLLYTFPVLLPPFAIIGLLVLIRLSLKNPGGITTPFLSWVIALLVLLWTLGIMYGMIPPFRALILLHLPILAALGVFHASMILVRMIQRASTSLPNGHFLRWQAPDQAGHVGFTLLATAMVVVSGIGLHEKANDLLYPVVPEGPYNRLAQGAEYIEENSWPEPLYLILNDRIIETMPPIRYELSLLHGQPVYLFYGDINFLPWLVEPNLLFPHAATERLKASILDDEYRKTRLRFDPQTVLAHPIVVVRPELFEKSLPTSFHQYWVSDGFFVIPPYALSMSDFYSWEILAAEDYYQLGNTTVLQRDWARYEMVLETYVIGGYEISFPHFFPLEGNYSLALHLFSFPEKDYETTAPLSPLEIAIDGNVLATLVYGKNEVLWWNVTANYVTPGLKLITLRSTNPELPFRMSLDVIVVSANAA